MSNTWINVGISSELVLLNWCKLQSVSFWCRNVCVSVSVIFWCFSDLRDLIAWLLAFTKNLKQTFFFFFLSFFFSSNDWFQRTATSATPKLSKGSHYSKHARATSTKVWPSGLTVFPAGKYANSLEVGCVRNELELELPAHVKLVAGTVS